MNKDSNRKTRPLRRHRREAPKTFLPSNRTIDDSLATTLDEMQTIALRDLMSAPGQVPLEIQDRSDLGADELYGQTQIPHRAGRNQASVATHLKDAPAKSTEPPGAEKSRPDSDAYDPRKEQETNADEARDGVEREIGRKPESGRHKEREKL
jgi:hypothetical protein